MFIIKNNNALILGVSVIQTILNTFFSEIFTLIFGESTLIKVLVVSIITVIVVEFIPRYIANKTRKYLVCNFFLVGVTYCLTYFLAVIIRFEENKKLTSYSEKDIIRFVKNLTVDHTLENEEAKLVQAAFSFDDIQVLRVMTKLEKVIVLNLEMNWKQVKKNVQKIIFLIFR